MEGCLFPVLLFLCTAFLVYCFSCVWALTRQSTCLEYVCVFHPVLVVHTIVKARLKPAPVDHAVRAHDDVNVAVSDQVLMGGGVARHKTRATNARRQRVCGVP